MKTKMEIEERKEYFELMVDEELKILEKHQSREKAIIEDYKNDTETMIRWLNQNNELKKNHQNLLNVFRAKVRLLEWIIEEN